MNLTATSSAVDGCFLRNPRDEDWSLTERPGFLRLNGSAVTLSDQDSPAFVGRRQTGLAVSAKTRLEFEPQHENEEAGITVRGNDANHVDLGVTLRDGKKQLFLRKVLGGKVEGIEYFDAGPGAVVLSVAATPTEYKFSGGADKGDTGSRTQLGTIETKQLSTEKVTGFLGACWGCMRPAMGRRRLRPPTSTGSSTAC